MPHASPSNGPQHAADFAKRRQVKTCLMLRLPMVHSTHHRQHRIRANPACLMLRLPMVHSTFMASPFFQRSRCASCFAFQWSTAHGDAPDLPCCDESASCFAFQWSTAQRLLLDEVYADFRASCFAFQWSTAQDFISLGELLQLVPHASPSNGPQHAFRPTSSRSKGQGASCFAFQWSTARPEL